MGANLYSETNNTGEKIKLLFRDLPPGSETGRHTVYSKILDRTFVIEPIADHKDNIRSEWGDINPATKKLEGDYGDKHNGAVKESESIITKENGFNEITYLKVGESPYGYIERLEKEFLNNK